MNTPVSRRGFLLSAASAAAAPLFNPFDLARAAPGLKFGAAEPFSWDLLIGRARARAAAPYRPPYQPAAEIVERIDYDAHGRIRFRPGNALFSDGPGVYPVTFFHLGRFSGIPVKMHAIDADVSREILYSPDHFEMPPDSPAHQLPSDAGFAGFRLHESEGRTDWRTQDWVAFLGASYFRSIGALNQYGISARGIALDVAAPTPEEFPQFVSFYIAPALAETDPVLIFALLDGPGISGAYRFAVRRNEGCVMDVETVLFTRRAIHRFGVAPLTSMFWYGEHNRPAAVDWRPEIHDSDGLALWSGAGERIWRPLNNPRRVVTSSFFDENPRGFGLLQRDRNSEDYLDGVNYERRPSLWVEPIGAWGKGTVQLVEIPTDDEIHDNIVAFWVPEEPVEAGQSLDFRYRLHWLADEPYPPTTLARTFATRIGRGGEPGKPRPKDTVKFVVEFAGEALRTLPGALGPQPVASASRGDISAAFAEPVPGTKRWRASFDLAAPGDEPVELRLFLRSGSTTLTETWLFQHHPKGSA